jgi:hypothetical protein
MRSKFKNSLNLFSRYPKLFDESIDSHIPEGSRTPSKWACAFHETPKRRCVYRERFPQPDIETNRELPC